MVANWRRPFLLSTAPIVVDFQHGRRVDHGREPGRVREDGPAVLACPARCWRSPPTWGSGLLPLARSPIDTIVPARGSEQALRHRAQQHVAGVVRVRQGPTPGGLQFPATSSLYEPARRSHAAGHVVGGHRPVSPGHSADIRRAAWKTHARSIRRNGRCPSAHPSTHVYDMWDGRSIFVKFEPLRRRRLGRQRSRTSPSSGGSKRRSRTWPSTTRSPTCRTGCCSASDAAGARRHRAEAGRWRCCA